MQTITTVGFGDIGICLLEEYLLALLWMVFGVSIYTITIGSVSSLIASNDAKAAILNNKLEVLSGLAVRVDIEEDLAMRINRFLENESKDLTSLEDQDHLVDNLPPSLRKEVLNIRMNMILNKLPFFKDKNADF